LIGLPPFLRWLDFVLLALLPAWPVLEVLAWRWRVKRRAMGLGLSVPLWLCRLRVAFFLVQTAYTQALDQLVLLVSPAAVVILAVALIALVAFYWRVYRIEGRRLTDNQRRFLWALRLTVGAVVLFMLARPALNRIKTDFRLPVVALVLDESTSMAFPNERDDELTRDNPLAERSRYDGAKKALDLLQGPLSKTHHVVVYRISDRMEFVSSVPHRASDREPPAEVKALLEKALTPTGVYSNLGDGLADVAGDLSGSRVPAIVLLSDGRVTGGTTLSEAADAVLAQARATPLTPRPPAVVSTRAPSAADGYVHLGLDEYLNLKDRLIYSVTPAAGGYEYYQKYAGALPAVHAVTFGADHPLRDLRIDNVDVPPEASLGDPLIFNLTLTNYIRDSLAVDLRLFEKGKGDPADKEREVRRRQVRWSKMGRQTVSITTIPETEGEREFRLELPTFEDEINTDNNQVTIAVNVVKRGLRVLLIGGQPTLEYHFLVPTLLRDPVLNLSCFLQSADVDYIHQGNTGIDRLPRTTREWNLFDVVILADPDPKELSSQQVAGIENLVAKGGGLLILAGRCFGLDMLLQVHPTKIDEMLPVQIDRNLHPDYAKMYTRPFKAARTPAGMLHQALAASTDRATDEAIWATFPEFYWRHPVLGPKKGAVVLLEKVGEDDGEGNVLMATRRYGNGAVFYSGLNMLWRWRYPSESYDLDRLWNRIVRYLGETRLLGAQKQVSLSTDKAVYAPGEDVTIILRILDPALMEQLRNEHLFVTVTGSGGERQSVPLTMDPRMPEYRGLYTAQHIGRGAIHAKHVSIKADSEGKPLFDVQTSFEVKVRSLEELDTSADLEGMKALADRTFGKYLDYRTVSPAALAELAAAIPTAQQEVRQPELFHVWDTLSILILFLILASAEWSLRKLWGVL
jgi:uncharacterized membrane protein